MDLIAFAQLIVKEHSDLTKVYFKNVFVSLVHFSFKRDPSIVQYFLDLSLISPAIIPMKVSPPPAFAWLLPAPQAGHWSLAYAGACPLTSTH